MRSWLTTAFHNFASDEKMIAVLNRNGLIGINFSLLRATLGTHSGIRDGNIDEGCDLSASHFWLCPVTFIEFSSVDENVKL